MAHFLIVAANYYENVCNELLLGARTHLEVAGHSCDVIYVPGAFEIPAAIHMAMHHTDDKYDGYVALGCVIRGETSHYDLVCNECARGLQEIAIRHHAAIGFGVLTVESVEQANYRASVNVGNKGKEAADAAMRMVGLRAHFRSDVS